MCYPPHPWRLRERPERFSFQKTLREWKLWRKLWRTSKFYLLFAQIARLSTQEKVVVFLPPGGGPSSSEEAILWPSLRCTQLVTSSFSEQVWPLLKGQTPPGEQAGGPGCGEGDSAGNSSSFHATLQERPRGSPSQTSLRGQRPHS